MKLMFPLQRQGLRWLAALGLILAGLFGLAAPVARATDIGTTPHISLAGHYNYVVTGGSLRASNNNNACTLLSGLQGNSVDAGTNSAQLSGIPAGASIVGAYLYFAGDGDTADYNVNFNGTPVTAQRQYSGTVTNGSTMQDFGGFVDVTSLVSGNGTYSFSGLSVQNVDGSKDYCSTQNVLAGWALVVVYQHASEPLRVVNIFDGMQLFWGSSITLTPNNFQIPNSGIDGKFTVITWEGDASLDTGRNGVNENLEFNGYPLTDGLNPANQQYNDTIDYLGSGTNNNWGVDIDTYDVSGYLQPGSTGATTLYSSGSDAVFLTAQVISVTNTPVADLAISLSHNSNFTYGTNGSYTVHVRNNGPSDTSGTTTVTDTLPAGLTFISGTGTGWTCSASGQVVTCTTTSVIANGGNANPIALNVAVGSGATSSIVNTASVAVDPAIFDNISTNNTASDSTMVNLPDLSTSTKTVVDTNGGNGVEAKPGDVLKYTITLKESAGVAASNVSVTDDMPAHVGDLTIVSPSPLPAGWVNNSNTTTGGANNTGQLNISGINVPANGNVTIAYTVAIDGNTDDGTTIDNTATITNPDPSGIGATPAAPSLTVAQSPLPPSGNKVLYLYDNTGPTYTSILNRVPQTANSTAPIEIDDGHYFQWNLSPTIATGKTLELPAQNVGINLVMAASGSQTGSNRSVTVELCNDTDCFASTTITVSGNNDRSYPGTIHIPAQTIQAGSGLNLRISTNAHGNNRNITVSQMVAGAGNNSKISFTTSTVIKVESVGTYNDASCTTPYDSTHEYQAGSTVYLCAVVSDPFGSADVDPTPGGTAPSVAITDADGSGQVIAAMRQVADSGAASKTFEYTYTVPATTTALGDWTATVTAWEGTEGTVYRSGSSQFSVAAPHPDLSTSTKTVADTNGGYAEPGDTLEYTITLKETAGVAANNIHVTDDMPANVGNLTVIDNAGGDASATTTTGGANGTGKLDITGISLPANGSKTIVYRVTIANDDTLLGTTIDNTATITGPDATGATPAAPTVTILRSAQPASGNKILYVHNNVDLDPAKGTLTRTPQTAAGGGVSIAAGSTATWTLATDLAKPLTIKANSTISVNLMVSCSGYSCKQWAFDRYMKWSAELYDSDGSKIGTTSANETFYYSSPTQATANIDVGSADITIQPNHKLFLKITEMDPAWFGATLHVEQYTGKSNTQFSYVSLDVSTVINVDSVDTYTNATCATPTPDDEVYETNSKVYICAVVSDPFGKDDIDPSPNGTAPTITITDADGAQQVPATAMTEVTDRATDATKTFGYTYTVPTSPPATLTLGHWTPSVTAWEGTEHTISHTAKGDFDVEAPDLVVVKSVSAISDPVNGSTNAKALPGATMQYSIIITNQGKGAVDANQLNITDPIPAHTAFVVGSVGFTDGSTSSGLDPATNVSYSNDGGATWTYTPVGSDGDTDPAVTNIRFSPQGSMNGKTGASAPACTITFQVKIL